GTLKLFLRCKHRHLHSVAKFAVYLDDDFNLVLDEQPLIVDWPALFSDVARSIAEFCIEFLPELGGNVRRKWIQQTQETAHCRYGNRVNVGECVHENHHL